MSEEQEVVYDGIFFSLHEETKVFLEGGEAGHLKGGTLEDERFALI